MLCPSCLGANMADQGQYYQCPRCGDIQAKCRQDRGVQKFHKACLQRREPTTQQRVKQFITLYHASITTAILLSIMVCLVIFFQMGGR